MVAKCYSCGLVSPSVTELQLLVVLGWAAVSSVVSGAEFFRDGKLPQEGTAWFCPICSTTDLGEGRDWSALVDSWRN